MNKRKVSCHNPSARQCVSTLFKIMKSLMDLNLFNLLNQSTSQQYAIRVPGSVCECVSALVTLTDAKDSEIGMRLCEVLEQAL